LLLKEITMLRTFATAATLALGITLNVTAARADDASTNVTYGDLDLSQPADAKILADRLQGAARSVCLAANPDGIAPSMLQNCITGSISMAMSQIESRLDQAVHAKLGNIRTAMQSP
jgi:UrcA family protein